MEHIVEHREITPVDFQDTPYRLVELLGSGSYGSVYKARERASGRKVAVKVPTQYSIQDEAERRFLRRVLQRGDPDEVNIIRLLNVIRVRGVPSLVLEYHRMSLCEFLKENTRLLAISQVRCLGIQLFSAIRFLQGCEIVHSDIKPANIMVAGLEGNLVRVKLIDLGGFEVSEARPAQVWCELTPFYFRAPEVVMGLPASFPIDVWAVALVLIEAFLGKSAFPAQSNKDLMAYFRSVFGGIPRDLLEGVYVSRYFERVSDGRYSWKASPNPQDPTPLGREFNNLLLIAMDEEDDYKSDTAYFVDLIKKALRLSPRERITAEAALEESFFTLDHFEWNGSDHENTASQLVDSLSKTSC